MKIDLDGESWFSGDFDGLEFYLNKKHPSHLKIISIDETPINLYVDISDLMKMRDQLEAIIHKLRNKTYTMNTIIRGVE